MQEADISFYNAFQIGVAVAAAADRRKMHIDRAMWRIKYDLNRDRSHGLIIHGKNTLRAPLTCQCSHTLTHMVSIKYFYFVT